MLLHKATTFIAVTACLFLGLAACETTTTEPTLPDRLITADEAPEDTLIHVNHGGPVSLGGTEVYLTATKKWSGEVVGRGFRAVDGFEGDVVELVANSLEGSLCAGLLLDDPDDVLPDNFRAFIFIKDGDGVPDEVLLQGGFDVTCATVTVTPGNTFTPLDSGDFHIVTHFKN